MAASFNLYTNEYMSVSSVKPKNNRCLKTTQHFQLASFQKKQTKKKQTFTSSEDLSFCKV